MVNLKEQGQKINYKTKLTSQLTLREIQQIILQDISYSLPTLNFCMFPMSSAWLNECFSYRDSLLFKTSRSEGLIASALASEHHGSSAQWEFWLQSISKPFVCLDPGKHQIDFWLVSLVCCLPGGYLTGKMVLPARKTLGLYCSTGLQQCPIIKHNRGHARQEKNAILLKEFTYLQMRHIFCLQVFILKGAKAGISELAQTASVTASIDFFPPW